jgi:hypothetical protein
VSDDDRTKEELKQELRDRDLPVSGTKQELLDRLEEAEAGEGADDGDEATEDEARGEQDAEERGGDTGGGATGSGGGRRGLKPMQVARLAAQQLRMLTGREVEGAAGLERADEGWRVLLEVLEVARVPRSTDVLGVYEVTVDAEGDVVSYERLRRYVRAQAGDDQ